MKQTLIKINQNVNEIFKTYLKFKTPILLDLMIKIFSKKKKKNIVQNY